MWLTVYFYSIFHCTHREGLLVYQVNKTLELTKEILGYPSLHIFEDGQSPHGEFTHLQLGTAKMICLTATLL